MRADDAFLGQRLAESGLDRYGVENGVYRGAGQHASLMQGNAEFVEGSHQLGVDLLFLWSLLGRGKIDDVLEIYLGNI